MYCYSIQVFAHTSVICLNVLMNTTVNLLCYCNELVVCQGAINKNMPPYYRYNVPILSNNVTNFQSPASTAREIDVICLPFLSFYTHQCAVLIRGYFSLTPYF